MAGGGPERVARQHQAGKLTARERIDLLVRSRQLRRDRQAGHPPLDRLRHGRATRSPATAWSPATARRTAGRCSCSRRTSPCSAARCPRPTPSKICKIMDLATEGGRARRWPERLGGRAHPGRRGVAGGLCGDLPAQHHGVGRRAAALGGAWGRARAARSTRPPSPTSSSWSSRPATCSSPAPTSSSAVTHEEVTKEELGGAAHARGALRRRAPRVRRRARVPGRRCASC